MTRSRHRKRVAGALAVLALGALAGGSTGSANPVSPDLPQVDVPSTPSLPKPPSTPTVPDLPSEPAAPAAPRVETPQLPQTPDTRSPTSTSSPAGAPGTGSDGAPGAAPGSATAGADSDQRGEVSSAAAERSQPGRETSPTARREARTTRKLRRAVRQLQGCLYAISGFERRVLSLRAGIGDAPTLSRQAVASRLEVSTKRVRRAERRGVRRLRRANRSLGCGATSLHGTTAEDVETLVTAGQQGPQFAAVSDLDRDRRSVASSGSSDTGAVRGAEAGSGQTRNAGGRGRIATATADPTGGSAGPALAGIAAGVLLLTALLVLLLRRARPAAASSTGWEPEDDWRVWEPRTTETSDAGAQSASLRPNRPSTPPAGKTRSLRVLVPGVASLVLGRLLGSRLRRRR
jgi:hypothetical protein